MQAQPIRQLGSSKRKRAQSSVSTQWKLRDHSIVQLRTKRKTNSTVVFVKNLSLPKRTTVTELRSFKRSKVFKRNIETVDNYYDDDTEDEEEEEGPTISLFLTIPPEIFAVICAYLPPAELFTLSRVCRRFRGFLWSTTSAVTESIWRISRTTFLRYPNMAPPTGLAELEYLRLVMEKGCMFCDKEDGLTIYWEFQTRCCIGCLEKITVRDYHLSSKLKRMNIPQDIIFGLPYLLRCNTPKYNGKIYLQADIKRVHDEYLVAPNKGTWVTQKNAEVLAFLQDARERVKDTQTNQKILIMIERGRRYKIISAKIKELAKELRNSKTSIGQTEYLLKRCPSYRRVVDVPKPFTERSWNALVKKLEVELPNARQLSRGTLPSNDEIWEIREELRERVRRLQARLAETFDENY
ncbi:6495_t:CDS:2 [Ambispora gerdemannii]|uniref:6495_t:CDS:1 n=1 Tax=Ambispora gerdemannii TaxID=144530 RepID=A0A9N8V9Y6_9GLOM|nr:6495_t:CDS:2 [Ambispora gerdemannii]